MAHHVSRRAGTDLDDIALHTLLTWGAPQMERYMRSLDARFLWLAENPDLGRRRDEITPGLRSFLEGSHSIFYRMTGEDIEIVAVLHHAQNATQALGAS